MDLPFKSGKKKGKSGGLRIAMGVASNWRQVECPRAEASGGALYGAGPQAQGKTESREGNLRKS